MRGAKCVLSADARLGYGRYGSVRSLTSKKSVLCQFTIGKDESSETVKRDRTSPPWEMSVAIDVTEVNHD